MFSTESAVRQLRPDKILWLVSGVEERQWRQSKLLDLEESCGSGANSADPGLAILRHGTAVKKIHGYFSNLEFRRCCMLLAGRKFAFHSVRVLSRDRPGDHDPESASRLHQQPDRKELVATLDGKEFQCFRHAFLCASFPVLGAPDPPDPHSPTPTSSGHPSSPQGFPNGDVGVEGTALWLDDSGVEVSDDVAMIPTETLCDLLQRAFRLSQDRYRHYQQAIATKYRKKTPQKVLAEELVGQLTTLENNNHPFYNPHTFLSKQAYGLWQQAHRNTISRLLNKFWHTSLPLPCDLQGAQHDLDTVHNDYVLLLNKLLEFEDRFGAMDSQGGIALIKPLSSASLRLLREFSLRYGIGEVFVQAVYLEQLSRRFTPSPGLVTHTTAVGGGLTRLLGGQGGGGTRSPEQQLVRKELDIVVAALDLLQQQASTAITQMKRLFPGNQPPQAVETLIELAAAVQSLQCLLTAQPQESLPSLLQHLVQRAFPPDYAHHKTVARSELAEKRDTEVSPKLLNVMIGVIRDEVIDYKTSFHSTFKQYFDVTTLAAQTYYSLLMADVEILCQGFSQSMSLDINLLMVGLAYRLNQLDHDWSSYIPPEAQVWRQSFQPQLLQWCLALKVHLQDFVLEAVAGDSFSTKNLHLENVSLSASASTSTLTQHTTPSLSPSATSAFSSIHPSVASPHVQTIPEEVAVTDAEDMAFLVPGAWTLGTVSRPRPKTSVDSRPKQQQQSSYLTFSTLRHSTSLPDIAGAVAEEKKIDEQMRAMGGSGDSGEMETAFGCPSESDGSTESPEEESEKNYQYPPVEEVARVQSFTCMEEQGESGGAKARPLFNRFLHSQPPSSTTSSSASATASAQQPAPPARGARTSAFSSVVGQGRGKAGSERVHVFSHDFEDSLGSLWSNLSLSMPDTHQDAELPVSGSLVDVLVLLRRLAAFATTLMDAVFPDSHSTGSLTDTSLSPGPEVFHRQLSFSGASSTSSSVRGSLPPLPSIPPAQLKAKWDVLRRMRKCLHASLALYADNMLSLDLCGTPRLTAARLVGIKLVEHLMMQREGGLLWGCRHEMEGLGDCHRYSRPSAALLCDRYEPISHKMCVRINNIVAAMELLDVFEGRLEAAAGRQHSAFFAAQSSRNLETPSSTSLDEYSVIDGDEGEEGWGGLEEPGVRSCSTSSLGELPPQDVQGPVHAHLMAVFRGQVRLLAYRLNLFVKDALSLLMTLNQSSAAIETSLAPLTSFLRKYLDELSSWLYRKAFRVFLECLWINIVQDFELETERLREEAKDSEGKAHRLLQAVMHLLKFMNNFGRGVTKSTMLAQAEGVIFRLQLYTLSTAQLMAVHSQLSDYMYDVQRYWEPDSCLSHILAKMQQDLQARRKCFSGSDLVSWILRHRALFCDLDPAIAEAETPFTREVAARVAQVLLDKRLVGSVDREAAWGRSHSGSLLSSPDPTYHYPELTPVSTQPLYGTPDLDSESSDSDLTPMASPVPPCQPPLCQPTATKHHPSPLHAERNSIHPSCSENSESRTGADVSKSASEGPGSSSSHQEGTGKSGPTEDSSSPNLTSWRSEVSKRDSKSSLHQQGEPAPSRTAGADDGVVDRVENSGGRGDTSDVLDNSETSTSSCPTPTNMIQSIAERSEENSIPGSESHVMQDETQTDATQQVFCHGKGFPEMAKPAEQAENVPVPSRLSIPGVQSVQPGKSQSNSSCPTKFPSGKKVVSQSPAPCSHYMSFPSSSVSHSSTPTTFSRPQPHPPPTPLSSFTPISFMSSHSSYSAFVDSSEEFFYVLPAAVEMQNQSAVNSPAVSQQEPLFDLSEMKAERLKKSPETLHMAIQCFQQKIAPLHLLSIIYQRRQSSMSARKAVRRMPTALREQIKYHLNLPVSGCVNS